MRLQHPPGTVVLEGTPAEPAAGPTTWSCPSCRRTRVLEPEQLERRRLAVTCAGDPLTGAPHPPADMITDRLPAVR